MSQMMCNVRGLGSRDRKRLVRDLVSRTRPDVVILQETKLMNPDRAVVCSLCHFGNVNWISLPSVGQLGEF